MTRQEKLELIKHSCSTRYCLECPVFETGMCNEAGFDDMEDADLDKVVDIFARQSKEENLSPGQHEYDVVERPQHYTSTSIECIDAMIETQGADAVKAYCVCNAFKYLWRHNAKNGDEDIKKANWYLNKAVELMGDEE